jgi:hypothetical protein
MGALDALARQVTGSRPGLADLGPALRRQASQVAAELDVRCDIDDGLDLPRLAVEALGAAAGEALRNVAAHAPIGMGLAAALRVMFRRLSCRTESRLAEYGERVRMQAWAEAISRVDSATLENARRVAGPVLEEVASGQAPSPALRRPRCRCTRRPRTTPRC